MTKGQKLYKSLKAENPFFLYEEEVEETEDGSYEEAGLSEEAKKATIQLCTLIADFSEKYRKLSKKYKNVGFGDTSTDENIVDIIYEQIH